ncbi:hypothetical protein LSAT2_018502, partial [Lamellibrachia satsuma]
MGRHLCNSGYRRGGSVTYSESAFRRSSSMRCRKLKALAQRWRQAAEKSPAFNIFSVPAPGGGTPAPVPATADLAESSHPLRRFLVCGDTAHVLAKVLYCFTTIALSLHAFISSTNIRYACLNRRATR